MTEGLKELIVAALRSVERAEEGGGGRSWRYAVYEDNYEMAAERIIQVVKDYIGRAAGW